ncbi:MAG: hypothetical protein U0787_06930 [Polyangia bacterium]
MQKILGDIRAGVLLVPSRPPPSKSATDILDGRIPNRRRTMLAGGVALAGGLLGLAGALYWVFTAPVQRPHPDAGAVKLVTPPVDAGSNRLSQRIRRSVHPTRVHQPPQAATETNPGKTPVPPKKDRDDGDGKPGKLGNLTMPPFIDRNVALGKIEEGRLALNANRNEVGFNPLLCGGGKSAGARPGARMHGRSGVWSRTIRRGDQVGQASAQKQGDDD